MSLNLALVVSLADKASRPLKNLGGNVEALGAKADRVGRSISGLGATAVPRLTLPIAAFGGFALRATGQMEQMEVAFESMLGGADRAKAIVKDLSDFSARTPFQLTGIGNAASRLLTEGVGQSDVIDRLSMLGDIAAGARVPLEDMTNIYAKTMGKGKAQTEELNQLSERGVPILNALVDLAARYGNEVSKEDVYRAAERGQISFKTLQEALELMTEKGGIFHDQMQKQSQTLSGLFSTLKDNVFNALVEIGEQIDRAFSVKDNMRRLIAWVGDATERFKRLAEERPGLVKLGLRIAAIAAAAGPVLVAVGVLVSTVGVAVSGLGAMVSSVGAIVGAMGAAVASVAAFLGPIGLVVAAITGAAVLMRISWADVFDWLQGAWSAMLAWFSGPGEDQTIFDWLSAPVTGLFDWIASQWVDALAWIASPDTDILAWLGSGASGVFDWIARQWDAVMGWMGANGPDIHAWLGSGASGVFDWIARQWDAVMGWMAANGPDILAWLGSGASGVFDWFTIDYAGWAAGLLAGLATAVGAIDFGSIGKLIGGAIRRGLVALAGLYKGLFKGLYSLFKSDGGRLGGQFAGALLSILGGIGKLGVAIVKSGFSLIVGIVDGLFGTDLRGVFERFREFVANFSLLEAMSGWWSGVAGWFARKWGEVKAIVRIAAWSVALKAFSLLQAMSGWWSGVAGWFARKWGEVKAIVRIAAWIAALKAFSLLEAGKGWIDGLWEGVRDTWGKLQAWFMDTALGEWAASIGVFSLLEAGKGWIDSLWTGIRNTWGEFQTWFLHKIDELFGWVPEFVRTRLGIDVEAPGADAGESVIVGPGLGAGEPRETLYGRRDDRPDGAAGAVAVPQETRVGGEVRLVIDSEGRARVRELRSDNPHVELSVETGGVMAYS